MTDTLTTINAEVVRRRLGQLHDELSALITDLDTLEAGQDKIAEHARSRQVPTRQAAIAADVIADHIGTTAGHLRRAQQAVRHAHHRAKTLISAEEEASRGRA